MTFHRILTRPISVPIYFQFIYGRTTTYPHMVFIHGSAVIASLLVLAVGRFQPSQSIGQQLALMVLAWDLVGGLVAHCLPQNRAFWRTMRTEWLVLWIVSYSWQPLLFSYLFGGGLVLLAGFHLSSILLIVSQYVFGNRTMFLWVALALLIGGYLNWVFAIAIELQWLAPLYLVKAVVFDKVNRNVPAYAKLS